MSEETNSTTDEIDLEELVGGVLDSRGLTKERIDSLGGLGEKLDALIAGAQENRSGNRSGNGDGGTPAPKFDEEGFLAKVSALVDEKLSAANPPKKAPLSRWLGL